MQISEHPLFIQCQQLLSKKSLRTETLALFVINEMAAAKMDGRYFDSCSKIVDELEKIVERQSFVWQAHNGFERGEYLNYKDHFQIVVGHAYNHRYYMYIYAGTKKGNQKMIHFEESPTASVGEYKNKALDLVDEWTSK
jgi:hypothetical protein